MYKNPNFNKRDLIFKSYLSIQLNSKKPSIHQGVCLLTSSMNYPVRLPKSTTYRFEIKRNLNLNLRRKNMMCCTIRCVRNSR